MTPVTMISACSPNVPVTINKKAERSPGVGSSRCLPPDSFTGEGYVCCYVRTGVSANRGGRSSRGQPFRIPGSRVEAVRTRRRPCPGILCPPWLSRTEPDTCHPPSALSGSWSRAPRRSTGCPGWAGRAPTSRSRAPSSSSWPLRAAPPRCGRSPMPSEQTSKILSTWQREILGLLARRHRPGLRLLRDRSPVPAALAGAARQQPQGQAAPALVPLPPASPAAGVDDAGPAPGQARHGPRPDHPARPTAPGRRRPRALHPARAEGRQSPGARVRAAATASATGPGSREWPRGSR